MNIKGNIRITINRDISRIEIIDKNANISFLDIELNPVQFSEMFHVSTDCEIEIKGINFIGKKRVSKKIEFEVPLKSKYDINRKKIAISTVKAMYNNTIWTPSLYFDSQDSFFEKNGKIYAKTTIDRWVEKK